MLSYFAAYEARVEYKESYYSDGELKSREPVIIAPGLPTFELFAAKIGADMEELAAWQREHAEFARACSIAKSTQLGMLKTYGLLKQYDASLAKFLIASEHGVGERSAEQGARVEFAIPPEIAEECN